jgi:hypothetical protein
MSKSVFAYMDTQGITVNVSKIRWCLTVPAIWSYHSKDIMLNAASRAGLVRGPTNPTGSIYEVQIVPEPEAAALCCLQKLRELRPKGVDL